jgi:acetyltransferase-like isoleucine patch superfamily enzyme
MLKKIISFFRSGQGKKLNYSTGKNTVVKGTIFKADENAEVTIGDECLIEGTLTTYTPNAKIIVGDQVFIGKGTLIGSAGNITIGNNVLISFDCLIQDTDTHHPNIELRKNDVKAWMNGKKDWSQVTVKTVRIDSGAWLGAKCIILKGVHIGENAIVGAGSVVTKNVEANTVVGGNPARLIKNLK